MREIAAADDFCTDLLWTCESDRTDDQSATSATVCRTGERSRRQKGLNSNMQPGSDTSTSCNGSSQGSSTTKGHIRVPGKAMCGIVSQLEKGNVVGQKERPSNKDNNRNSAEDFDRPP